MQFVSVRDFRSKSAQVWKQLAKEQELVVTSNGKPVAVLSSCPEGRLEASLDAIRRGKALLAMETLQLASVRQGASNLSGEAIDREIRGARKSRRS